MNSYRKLIVAVIGLVLLIANDHLGLPIPGDATILADTVISLGTAVGVWGVSNG